MSFFVIANYLSDPSWRYDQENAEDHAEPKAAITSRVYFDVSLEGEPIGRIVMGLHGHVVPKTVKNFETICRGGTEINKIEMTYNGCPFHRIIPGFMIQGGSKPGRSIYENESIYFDGRFKDENFQLKHIGPDILSMANAGRDTNTSQLFITTKRTPHLDGKHVVFGTVLSGWDVVKEIESYGRSSGEPRKNVVITQAGVLEDSEEGTAANSKEKL